jgi:hypothetical protein
MQLAGGPPEAVTLLSVVAPTILSFFSTADALALRLICREFTEAVSRHPWAERTVIRGRIGVWRACFPRAICANVSRRNPWYKGGRRAEVGDEDFAHFAGLHELWIDSAFGLTNAAFAHLGSVKVLHMHSVSFDKLTPEAFAHLTSLRELSLGTSSARVQVASDLLFAQLKGQLRTLRLGCARGITGAVFAHFRGIENLDMSGCLVASDAVFEHLGGVRELGMSCCDQDTITDAAFEHLKGIKKLDMSWCNQATITDAAFEHLKGIQRLCMSGCNQSTITDAAFEHLKGIQELDMSGCNQAAITDAAFAHLSGIQRLDMSGCTQATITGAAFAHLRGIKRLEMRDCSVEVKRAAFAAGLPVAKPLEPEEEQQEDGGG